MSEYDNTNSGALFKNDKQGNEKRPDYRGPLNLNGTDYDLAAWLKKDRNGKTYMSLKIQPKEQRQRDMPPTPPPAGPDDQIPF